MAQTVSRRTDALVCRVLSTAKLRLKVLMRLPPSTQVDMAVPRLPDELIALIVEHLVGLYDEKGRDDDGNRREAALASCCRVGRAFLPPARASLYQRFSIGFEPSREEERGVEGVDEDVAADVLQCAWSTERAYGLAMNPHLGLLIRKLDLNVDFRQSDSVDEYAPALALATALRSAPRVVGIRLAATWGEFASSYFPPLFDVLIKVRPSLRRLDLDWSRFEDDVPAPQIPGIYPLLAALPLLEFLTLDQVHLPNLPVTFVAPFSLKYLSITNITGPALAAAFSSLTSNSSASLERLVTDGLTKFDLSPFSALNHFDVILAIDAQDFDDPANFEREAHHIARDNVGGMLASAKPSLCVVEIIDGGRVMPASAFNGAFFSSFPRTVVNLVMEDLAFETAALERLLERRPRALPRLSLLVVQGELWKAGPEEPWAANFRAAEVLLAFAGENSTFLLSWIKDMS